MYDPTEKDKWQKKAEQTVFECSHTLERAEAAKDRVKDFIDQLIKDCEHSYPKQLKEAWNLYKNYDDEIIPFSLRNLKNAKENLKDLKD